MAHTLTAQNLYRSFNQMPEAEKKSFFELIFARLFSEQVADASHEQLFGHLKEAQFTAQEAAEYLEVSLSTLRRMVASNKLYPAKTVGRNQFFAASDLKALKHR
jgi:excisionase family DNA binding protein